MTKDTKLKIWVYGICWSVGLLLCAGGLFVVDAFRDTDFVHRICLKASLFRSGYMRYEERTGEGEVGVLACDRCDFEIKIVPNE